MSNQTEVLSNKDIVFYSLGNLADTVGQQFFSFLIFTYYYVVVGLSVNYLVVGFIIWSIWNAINDPLLGAISDKTTTKIGKRKPWIIAGLIPFCILLVLVWTPPLGSQELILVYFLVSVMLFDLFYTMFSLNQVSLFPEMFQDLDQRAKANVIIQFIGVFGLIIAILLPSFFITPSYRAPTEIGYYANAGLFMAIVVGVLGGIFVKFGIKERAEFAKDSQASPSFFKSLSFSIKNKSFRQYVIANTMIFYVFGMLPIISPLYASFVLGVDQSIMQSVLLGLAIISAGIFMMFWRFISVKFGVKTGHIMVMGAFLGCLIPFIFASDFITGMIAYIIAGIGLSGALFFRAVTISAIIDQDELKTGVRREGGFYGINALFIRLSTIAIILTIGLVFNNLELAVFDTSKFQETATLDGLRSLMFLYPAIALAIGILSMSFFPITKQKYTEIREQIVELHQKKKQDLTK